MSIVNSPGGVLSVYIGGWEEVQLLPQADPLLFVQKYSRGHCNVLVKICILSIASKQCCVLFVPGGHSIPSTMISQSPKLTNAA